MTCAVRPNCSGCTFCESRRVMPPGLHVAALQYAEHPGPASCARLDISGLQNALTFLERTGEAGIEPACILLRQQIDELSGPYMDDINHPEDPLPKEDSSGEDLPQLYGDLDDEFRPVTMPFYGFRLR